MAKISELPILQPSGTETVLVVGPDGSAQRADLRYLTAAAVAPAVDRADAASSAAEAFAAQAQAAGGVIVVGNADPAIVGGGCDLDGNLLYLTLLDGDRQFMSGHRESEALALTDDFARVPQDGSLIGGTIDDDGNLMDMRLATGEVVYPSGQSFSDVLEGSRFLTAPSIDPTGGAIDEDGHFIRGGGLPVSQLPTWLTPAGLVATMNHGRLPLPVIGAERLLWTGAVTNFAARDSVAAYRLPLLVEMRETANRLGTVPRQRWLALAQARPTDDDTGANSISLKVSDDGGSTWSAERVLIVSGGAHNVANVSAGYDPATGRLELLWASTPAGYGETDNSSHPGVPAPSNVSGANGTYIRLWAAYCDDPFGAMTFRAQNGTPIAPPWMAAGVGTEQPAARDADTPYWSICPGQAMLATPDGKLETVGNGGGVPGGRGFEPLPGTAIAFLLTFDRTQPPAARWTWRMKTPAGTGFNESTLVIRRDGSRMVDTRSYRPGGTRHRGVAISDPSGTMWLRTYLDPARADAQVEGSLLRLSGGPGSADLGVVLAANLDEAAITFGANRRRLTVYGSVDGGDSWAWKVRLYPDAPTVDRDWTGQPLAAPVAVATATTGYSSMARIDDTTWLLAREGFAVSPSGTVYANGCITLHRLNLAALIRGFAR